MRVVEVEEWRTGFHMSWLPQGEDGLRAEYPGRVGSTGCASRKAKGKEGQGQNYRYVISLHWNV
jgi:hypothetical protein